MLSPDELSLRYKIVFPRVYNKNTDKEIPDTAIYVGRPSVWGNPYRSFDEANRDNVCDSFENYALNRLLEEPNWLAPLKGKELVCFCHPKRCHAHTLVRLANMPIWPVEGYFDGICESLYPGGPRNPGGVSAGGWVVKSHPLWWSLPIDITGHRVYRVGPGATNNLAEYESALDCLRDIYRAKWRGRVTLYGDSLLVVKQYSGEWKTKSPHLIELLEHLQRAASYFESVDLIWVPRKENEQADAQSRLAYEAHRTY